MRGFYDLGTNISANRVKLHDKDTNKGYGNGIFSANNACRKINARVLARVFFVSVVSCILVLGLFWQRLHYADLLTSQTREHVTHTTR